MLGMLPALPLQIVEFALEDGRVTMADMVKLTMVNQNTCSSSFGIWRPGVYLQRQGDER